MVVIAPTVKLNNGERMPVVGLGTFQLQGSEGKAVIKAAIDAGYRHFDTALLYHSEGILGEAIREKIADGTVRREDLFVTSKLWCSYAHPGHVLKACKRTLLNLGLDYVDLYLMHWPFAFKAVERPEEPVRKSFKDAMELMAIEEYFPRDASGQLIFSDNDYVETWKEMEKCVEGGMARSVGVSNFNSQQVERVLQHARIRPVTNQVECHPYLNQRRLTEFCRERDVVVTAYSPLSAGNPGNLPGMPGLLDNPRIVQVAKEVGRTPAQVILRYLVQLGTVVIPRTSKVKRLGENLAIFDFALSGEQMGVMDSLNEDRRACLIPGTESHKHYAFHAEF